ncbi:MAG: hypothetical protein WCD72_08010 [Dehalococcoidia bacterium]
MNIQALISLAVVVAYTPLFVILLFNRPWQRQHKLFVLNLVATVLWGLSNFLFRSDFFMQDRLLLFKVVMCFFAWGSVQFHYFLASFYQPKGFGFPYAYVLMAAIIVVTLLGYLAEGVAFINNIPVPVYGIAFIPVALSLFVLFGRDFYFFMAKV